MKVIYHDPNKSTQKLVIKPGDFFCPRLDTKPTIPGAIPQALPGAIGGLGSRPPKRGRPKRKTMVGALKRGAGNWL